jgi:hypothetical protein
MPADTVKIDRTTRWGNPFRVGDIATHPLTGEPVHVSTAACAVELFAIHVGSKGGNDLAVAVQHYLQGKHLACWCREGTCCHGDILLQVANAPVRSKRAA